nr:hypothetical protein [Tanacetum cinerariifolium]
MTVNDLEKEHLDQIDEADCDPKEEIRLIEKLLYDNSSPRPPKEINSKNSDAVIKFLSPSPIPVEDSDSLIGVGYFARNCTVRPRRRDAAYLQTQLLIAQKEEAGIQLPAEEFDLMAAAADLDEIEEVNANYGSAEVHNYKYCYDNDIFNMFTQEEQYTELLEPIPEPHQVPQNDNNIIFEDSSVEQSGGTAKQHPANVEETRALNDSLYQSLAIKVEKVNTVNRKLKETNAELTTELARFKIKKVF